MNQFLRPMAQGAVSNILQMPQGYGPLSQNQVLSSAQGFMNPYMQNVLGGLNDQYAQDLALAGKSADQQATAAGAFGGSRADITKGAMQAQTALGHEQQVGNLLYGGYNNALQNAMGLGQFNTNLQRQKYLDAINQQMAGVQAGTAGIGPYGQTQTQTQNGSIWNSLLGAGLIGLSFNPFHVLGGGGGSNG